MAIPSDLTVHPNLLEVALPTGGRAWVRRRLTHEQTYLRNAALVRFTASLPPGSTAIDADLASMAFGGVDTSETIIEMGRMKTSIVSACAWGWEGVRSPDGDDLSFPADIGRMDEADLDALYEAQEAVIVSADPNAGRGRSSSPSRRRSPTPAGRSRSTKPG